MVVGSAASLGAVIDSSDSMIFAMSLANVTGLYILARLLRREVSGYRERVRTGVVVAYK